MMKVTKSSRVKALEKRVEELAALIEKNVIFGVPTVVPEWQEAKERIEALEEKAVEMQTTLFELNRSIDALRLTWATTGGEFGQTRGHSKKFTESMPIWYFKRLENYEDRRTGPEIFFGVTELPKKPSERKTRKWTSHGGGGRRTGRQRPPAALHGVAAAFQPGFFL
ncbi:hypothetical protein JCGZ_22165 [Jatropha curcas]|uniref:Uncharacterized protein n=1 Tax=Jatropha curcas TaxID=180498 RepID=A0A067LBH2_JATCU|nr:hypothetical protein JCGZ_22165 [Jatropha curcas]